MLVFGGGVYTFFATQNLGGFHWSQTSWGDTSFPEALAVCLATLEDNARGFGTSWCGTAGGDVGKIQRWPVELCVGCKCQETKGICQRYAILRFCIVVICYPFDEFQVVVTKRMPWERSGWNNPTAQHLVSMVLQFSADSDSKWDSHFLNVATFWGTHHCCKSVLTLPKHRNWAPKSHWIESPNWPKYINSGRPYWSPDVRIGPCWWA